MVSARPHRDSSPPDGDNPAGLPATTPAGHGAHPAQPTNRLNLLLTAPAWRADTWADRLPSLLDPLGVRSVRARSARQAEHVIRSAPVHIAVVDLTLPLDEQDSAGGNPAEEGGVRILELLARMPSPPPTVVVQAPRGHRDSARCMSAALRTGAFAVVDRSAADIELILEVMRRVLVRFYGSRWPGPAPAAPRLYEDPRKGPGLV